MGMGSCKKCALPAVLFSCILLCACSSGQAISRSIQSLGTVITVTIHDRPRSEYFDGAFALVEEIHDLMSLEVAGSDLLRLKEAAGREAVPIHPHTLQVLNEALVMAERSSAAFTPLIEPLISLWGITGENPRVPSEEEIGKAQEAINLNELEITVSENPDNEPHRAFLKKAGMGIDFGGIAKGYAADLVSEYLKDQGVGQAILDFGGNIVTIGRKSEERPWIIGIQHPDKRRGEYLGTLPADDLSIVTSGVYERYFVDGGRQYHHLLDASTGFPADNGLDGVAVVSDRSIIADGYSTAVFVLGLEAGMALAEATEELEAVFISSDKRVYLSSGLRETFTLLDDEYKMETMEGVPYAEE